ncbi:hypothetical protein BKA69DRAFT_1021630, partial [Paraphysoderma sedebokerense]
DYRQLDSSTKVILNGGQFSTNIKSNGKFEFIDIPEGSYLVSILSNTFFFDKIRIDIGKNNIAYRSGLGFEWSASQEEIAYPPQIAAVGTKQYLAARESFSVVSLLANPMILMMGFTGLMLFAMPKLMENIRKLSHHHI